MRITTAAPRFLAQKFDCPRVSPGDAPLTKEPVDSGYEIGSANEVWRSFFWAAMDLSKVAQNIIKCVATGEVGSIVFYLLLLMTFLG